MDATRGEQSQSGIRCLRCGFVVILLTDGILNICLGCIRRTPVCLMLFLEGIALLVIFVIINYDVVADQQGKRRMVATHFSSMKRVRKC